MADAPERILLTIRPGIGLSLSLEPPICKKPDDIEYVRADLYAALEQEREMERLFVADVVNEIRDLREAIREWVAAGVYDGHRACLLLPARGVEKEAVDRALTEGENDD